MAPPAVPMRRRSATGRCAASRSRAPVPATCSRSRIIRRPRQRVLSISIAYVPSMDKHAIQISVPLDISIPKGLTLQTDTYTSPVLKYRRCDRNGCYVEMAVDNALVEGLAKSGDKGKVNIAADNGKNYTLEFFTQGICRRPMTTWSPRRAPRPSRSSRAPRPPRRSRNQRSSAESTKGRSREPAFFFSRLSLAAGLNIHGNAVHAIAQARRPRPVVEDMAQMAAAAAAMHFGALHEQACRSWMSTRHWAGACRSWASRCRCRTWCRRNKDPARSRRRRRCPCDAPRSAAR